jgi:hypothetical protein
MFHNTNVNFVTYSDLWQPTLARSLQNTTY